ncbi:bifunctional NMN adenylyltransferase/nudix hydrolase [Deinococcus metalli]|uniref:Bifunctional NMN adenylyltransferase/nudix hydrolase n=1 Tax=Deinococcus metalli TaxID=1141878 RepID=A0A7W8NMK1_9DEIO|nr:ADP-ribose pyrophosphatase [Deinococcus metalli]MBB5374781.1 bifunctional NMN adenylyltransferase/nudix hydrolase [Deinococcus metalli]GHF33765.1 bifunctional nicotinamide mononucleotide adenylyltransferase/ADP-ribose pyrophosphatase [Deinococcus metalli]
MSPVDGAVFIGRCQPPHDAHVGAVLAALDAAPRAVALLGSANLARSVRNPLSAPERARLLRAAVRDAGGDVRRVTIRPLPDRFDGERWAADVRAVVAGVLGPAARIALVGHEKDASGAYLRWFPGWTRVPLPGVPGLDATRIRAAWLTGAPLPPGVPPRVTAWLAAFAARPAFARLAADWVAVEAARAALPPGVRLHEERWLQIHAGQVWLHTRRGDIGWGLWELPGRVLSPGHRPERDGVVFGNPARALVGQAVAHVYRAPPPPDVLARPVDLAAALARPRRFHEDHHVILTRLLGG